MPVPETPVIPIVIGGSSVVPVVVGGSPVIPLIVGMKGAPGPAGLNGSGMLEIPFAYGDATPKTLTTAAANKTIISASIYIITPFNGTGASLKIGDATVTDNLMKITEVDPSTVGGFTVNPSLKYGTSTALILSINQGAGATQGAGIVLLQIEQ